MKMQKGGAGEVALKEHFYEEWIGELVWRGSRKKNSWNEQQQIVLNIEFIQEF